MMEPFVLAPYKDRERIKRTRYELYMRFLGNKEEARILVGKDEWTDEDLLSALDTLIEEQEAVPCYVNDKYQVMAKDMGDMIHLSIRRLDREVVRDWRDLQEIKNMLVGPEHTGLEVFPPESKLVDTANQYHLWVFKDPKTCLPFGFNRRLVTDDSLSTTKQRKRE